MNPTVLSATVDASGKVIYVFFDQSINAIDGNGLAVTRDRAPLTLLGGSGTCVLTFAPPAPPVVILQGASVEFQVLGSPTITAVADGSPLLSQPPFAATNDSQV